MADPTPYVPSYSYSGWQQNNPTRPLPADEVDNDFAKLRITTSELIQALRDVRRSDGALNNGIVTADSLAPQLSLGFGFEGEWAAGTAYQTGDGVVYENAFYRANVQHTSAADAPPGAGGPWTLLFSIDDIVVAGALAMPVDTFTGDGSTAAFGLSFTPRSAVNLIVSVGGVVQNVVEYSVNGNTITFNDPPAAGYAIEVRGFATTAAIVTPEDGSVTEEKLDPGVAALLNSALQPTDIGATVGNMFRSVYDPNGVEADAFDIANHSGDWSGGYVGAPAPLSAPNNARQRYIDVGSYCPSNDTLDAHAAIQAAFNAGEGREIVFTNPTGGLRYYRSLTRANGRLTMPKRARIIMAPGAILDFSDWANSGTVHPYLFAQAADPTATTAASNIDANVSTIVLSDATGYERGDDIILVSDAFLTTEDDVLGTKGEWLSVVDVTSNTLTVEGRTRGSYLTADNARVFRMNDLCELTVEGINLIGAGAFTTDTVGDRGIQIVNGKNCHVRDCDIKFSDQLSITFQNIINGSITGNKIVFQPQFTVGSTTNKYGPHVVNLCENILIQGNHVRGGKEAFGLTVSGGIQGPTRHIHFINNYAFGASRGGYTTHDNHENINFINNVAENCEIGFDLRIRDVYCEGNIILGTGRETGNLDAGYQLGSGGGKISIQGGYIEDALRGFVLSPTITHETPPGDITIDGVKMRRMRAHGVLAENTTGNTDELGTFTVQNCDIEGDGSSAVRGVELEGKWKPVVKNNVFRNGNVNRAVYLHATANGAGTNGPVNAVVTGNKWDSTYTEILIQHPSGKITLEDNDQLDATALPSVASSSALTLSTRGNVFNITGTTTINTILNAAAFVGRVITLQFSASLTVTNNANAGAANDIQLVGGANFSATANDFLVLCSNGTQWRELSRSAI